MMRHVYAIWCALALVVSACARTDYVDCGDYVCPANLVCAPSGGCTDVLRPCGDGVVDPDLNEACDDGNTIDLDGCSADCRSTEICGNGIQDTKTGESCDDGNRDDADGCRSDCTRPICGDGVRDALEACDAGPANSDAPDAACRSNCQLLRCGDAVVDSGEICDDGNVASGDGCAGDCHSIEVCGNHVIDLAAGEQCDDGNTASGDGCSADCRSTEVCGNGAPDGGEVCDDGNTLGGDGCSSDCRSNETCGNGLVDTAAGEQCDDGNADNGDGCLTTCRAPQCGDGFVQPGNGEACDDGAANSNAPGATCRSNCQPQRCSDEILDPTETCDDGNLVSGDGCSGDCRSLETCGNGYVDIALGEACDDGNNVETDACRNTCQVPGCGDGVVNLVGGETCDLGAANSNAPDAVCRLNCQPRRCGDAVRDVTAGEVCDDGNVASGDGCAADCFSTEVCGNGVVDVGEQCDDHNSSNIDSCTGTCRVARCGDGFIQASNGETCDAGAANANTANAACRSNCQPRRCGDGIIDSANSEVCDDGNVASGDGCAADCRSAEVCGNGIVDAAEECDDGNSVNTDSCAACQAASCGDGFVQASNGEACDAGAANANTANAACRTNCQPRRCGDGVIDSANSEVCDNGNVASGDGCSADCRSTEVCGNNIVDVGEQCDDGNGSNADTCHTNCRTPVCGDGVIDPQYAENCDNGAANSQAPNATCRTNCQPKRCGDAIVDAGELCDDGNVLSGDGCAGNCLSTETCGNGVTDFARGEECDLGANQSGDGCSSSCKLELLAWTSVDGYVWAPRGAGAAWDAERQQIVAFGGERGQKLLDETRVWVQSSGGWRALRTGPYKPSKRYGTTMAYQPGRRRVLLFGGLSPAGRQNDTWEWNGVRWTELSPAARPPARSHHGMAYDGTNVIVFGGLGTDGMIRSDTWAWNGTTWSQPMPATSPSARHKPGMVQSGTNQILLVGGATMTDPIADTWRWNGTTWQLVTTSGPSARWEPALAWDSVRGRIVLVGGDNWDPNDGLNDTWEFNVAASTWSQRFPSTVPTGYRTASILVYDPVNQQTVLHSGSYDEDSWSWDGTNWTLRGNRSLPEQNVALCADPVRGVILASSTNNGDTWEWNGRSWLRRGTPGGLPARYAANLAFDQARRELVLFGGVDNNTYARLNETWVWQSDATNPSWSLRNPATKPSARHDVALEFNSRSQQVMLFGGRDPAYNALADTWEWNGTTWTLRATTGPPARGMASLIDDLPRNQMVLFGGSFVAHTFRSDTWLWNGTSWSASSATGPAARHGARFFYDPTRRKGILAGGVGNDNFTDLWQWNGTWADLAAVGNMPIDGWGSAYLALSQEFLWYMWNRLQSTNINNPMDYCVDASVDSDGDGAFGCADPDCFAVCDPQCAPGQPNCLNNRPRCGDGICNTMLEQYLICPADCATPP